MTFLPQQRVTWLRYPHGGSEPARVAARVDRDNGQALVHVRIWTQGKYVVRHARREHLRARETE